MTIKTIDWDSEWREIEEFIQVIAQVRSNRASQLEHLLLLVSAARTDDSALQLLVDGIQALAHEADNSAETLIEVLPLWFDRHKALCKLEEATPALDPEVKAAIRKANDELEAEIPVKTVRYRRIAGDKGLKYDQVRYAIEGSRKTKKK